MISRVSKCATFAGCQQSASLKDDVKGLTIGVPRHHYFDKQSGDPERLSLVEKALGALEGMGSRLVEVTIPSLEYAWIANMVILLGEAFAYHRKNLQSQPENFGEIVRMRFYLAQTLQEVDVLATPTSFRPAATFEEFDPVALMMNPSFTAPFNEAGLPAISIPCGFNDAGLPIGLQIAGRPFDESTVLRVARAYEQHARWFDVRPSL